MDANTLAAVRLLGASTSGRFDIWGLAGPYHAATRARIMALALGVDKVPKAKAGVFALERELYRGVGSVAGDCSAAREDSFRELCRAAVPPAPAPTAERRDCGNCGGAGWTLDRQTDCRECNATGVEVAV